MRTRFSNSGFSIMELVFALALVMVAFYTFVNVFTSGAAHGVQTQSRAAANMIAQSYMDEFRSHRFGSPAPASWSEPEERPVRMVIKDTESFLAFQKSIEYETGAFVGTAAGNRDKVTLIVSWSERLAKAGSASDLNGQNVGTDRKDQQIRVEMPVWR